MERRPYLSPNHEHLVIGDVHGCIDELKALLEQNHFRIDAQGLIHPTALSEHRTIVLLGDFVDKASPDKLAETIVFIHQNYHHLNREKERFYLIIGNHEQMIYRYVTEDPTLEITPQRLEQKEKYYNTAALLESNEVLRSKFLELYDVSYVWLKYAHSDTFSITLTHAPCPEEHLTQNDKVSISKMIKCASRSKNRGVKLDTLLPYLIDEAKENRHYHIFGHLSQPSIRRYKNKICIDTSAIYGDYLSCAVIQGEQLTFDSTPFQHQQRAATQEYNLLFDFK